MIKKVLGVKIDDVNMDEAIERVESWLKKPGKHFIVTPNPEFLVTAKSDNQFQMILNRSDLSIPDGVGLKLAGVKNVVPGVDLMERLIKLSAEKGYATGFLGGKMGVAEKAAECLKRKYPKLKITYTTDHLPAGRHGRLPTTDLLFVAFGHPKQEYWIAENLKKIPVRVAMGVGGAFDYFSGKVPRAPKWIRDLGFEWLFRLILQPWRVKRQPALIKYIYLLTRHS